MDMGRLMLSALAAAILTLPFTVFLFKSGKIRLKSEIIVEEAKKSGRIAQAVLEKSRRSRGDSTSRKARERKEIWMVTYGYEVAGRSYKFRSRLGSVPPDQLELYYPQGHPERAIPEGYRIQGSRYTALMLLPLILWVFFYHFVFR